MSGAGRGRGRGDRRRGGLKLCGFERTAIGRYTREPWERIGETALLLTVNSGPASNPPTSATRVFTRRIFNV